MAKKPVGKSKRKTTAKKRTTTAPVRKLGRWQRVKAADGRLAVKVHKLERSAFFQISAIAAGLCAFAMLGFTAYAILQDFDARKDERENWRLDRVERAWNRLLRRASGNTGKGTALSYLLEQNKSVTTLDLSCKNIGDWENGKCAKPVVFGDLSFNPPRFQQSIRSTKPRRLEIQPPDPGLYSINMSDAVIENSSFTDTLFLNSNLERAIISRSNFSKTQMSGEFDGLHIQVSNLSGTSIILNGSITVFDSNVSGLVITNKDRKTKDWPNVGIQWSYALVFDPPYCSKGIDDQVDKTENTYVFIRVQTCPESILKDVFFCDTKKSNDDKLIEGSHIESRGAINCEKFNYTLHKHPITYYEARERYPKVFDTSIDQRPFIAKILGKKLLNNR